MHPAEIKAALAIAGYKQTAAAKECGVAPTTVGAVIHGRSRSKAVEEWIAHATGHTLVDLWPQWYGEPALVLSDDERALVKAYRELSVDQRARVLAAVRSGDVGAGHYVHADGGSNAAVGDIHIGGTAASHRKKK